MIAFAFIKNTVQASNINNASSQGVQTAPMLFQSSSHNTKQVAWALVPFIPLLLQVNHKTAVRRPRLTQRSCDCIFSNDMIMTFASISLCAFQKSAQLLTITPLMYTVSTAWYKTAKIAPFLRIHSVHKGSVCPQAALGSLITNEKVRNTSLWNRGPSKAFSSITHTFESTFSSKICLAPTLHAHHTIYSLCNNLHRENCK